MPEKLENTTCAKRLSITKKTECGMKDGGNLDGMLLEV